jgi:hypothetical protein
LEEKKMKTSNPSRAIALCGTEQPDTPGRILRAGPMTVEFDNGQLRYLKVNGVEVLRAVGFLVRDENWGTYTPAISNLQFDQRADSFSVSFHAVCKRPAQEIVYDARIEGTRDGNLVFDATAIPSTDFRTARTGFMVLHPLKGVAGYPVEVEHVDGRTVKDKFPELVNPIQPFLNIRALTHEVMPGLKATVRMEGDTYEMEDHRNWTDASFKTYVRPLVLPWPYTLKAGEEVKQSIKVKLNGSAIGSKQRHRNQTRANRPRYAAAGRPGDAGRGNRTCRRAARAAEARGTAVPGLPFRPAPEARTEGVVRLSGAV